MPSYSPYLLPYADVSWQSGDTPYAERFGDVYWSESGGAGEKHQVFIEGCDLLNRWRQLNANDNFTIAELGFGFGLNFLLALKAWQESGSQGRLQFVSFEAHLVPLREIERMANTFGLTAQYEQLAALYPLPIPGPHTLNISNNCQLILVVGDAREQSSSLTGQLDAIFLDGFSRTQNESLWEVELIKQFTHRLRPGGKLATYSVAGQLRRDLTSAGLTVTKVPGFGRKRQTLVAHAEGEWTPCRFERQNLAVIGAGLTGLFCAAALEARGHRVTLIDQSGGRHGAVAAIAQIAIYPQLSQTPQRYSNLYLRAFHYFTRHEPLNACGRLELLTTDAKVTKAEQLAEQIAPLLTLLTPEACSEILGFEVNHPGLFNSAAGWISPQTIEPTREIRRDTLLGFENTEERWQLKFERGVEEFDGLVLATGPEHLPGLEPLELMPLRGQSLTLDQPSITPGCVFSAEKTWFPNTLTGTGLADSKGSSTVSGTYDRFDNDTEIRHRDTEILLASVSHYTNTGKHQAQVGIRCATRDRLPIVGNMPNWQQLEQELTQRGNQPDIVAQQPGLYLSLGFGSHAGTLGPYCAQVLAASISGDLRVEDTAQLDPSRFFRRDKT